MSNTAPDTVSVPMCVTDALSHTLVAVVEQHPEVVLLACTSDFEHIAQAFPNRYLSFHREGAHAMIGVATGLARAGKVPVVVGDALETFCGTWEHIRALIARPALPVLCVGLRAGLGQGEEHAQCFEDITLMRVLPHMHTITPMDTREMHKALFASVARGAPTYIRAPDIAVPVGTNEDTSFHEGFAYHVWRSAHPSVTILGAGPILYTAIAVARVLDAEGVGVQVLNVHTIKPMDLSLVKESILETRAVVTLETHQILGGLGGTIAEIVAQNTPVPIEMLAVHDRFGSDGTPEALREEFNLHEDAIRRAVQRVLVRARGVV